MTKLRICSWNILAPELLSYFWRSSYGLDFENTNSISLPETFYDGVTQSRLDNIIKYLRIGNFDVILLQEITNTQYVISKGIFKRDTQNTPNSFKIHEYIAHNMGYYIISESYKTSKFDSGLPPYEQDRYKTISSIYSGVATLAFPGVKITNLITSKNCKKEASPFTLDKLEGLNGGNIYIANVHIKMNYPSILASISELYSCILDNLGTDILRTIVMGDFNAHALQAATELYKSELNKSMFDVFANELIDDHIFVGNDIRIYESKAFVDLNVPILEMGINSPATGKKWTSPSTKYMRSKNNQDLIDKKIATSDHSPIIIEFDFSKRRTQRKGSLSKI